MFVNENIIMQNIFKLSILIMKPHKKPRCAYYHNAIYLLAPSWNWAYYLLYSNFWWTLRYRIIGVADGRTTAEKHVRELIPGEDDQSVYEIFLALGGELGGANRLTLSVVELRPRVCWRHQWRVTPRRMEKDVWETRRTTGRIWPCQRRPVIPGTS